MLDFARLELKTNKYTKTEVDFTELVSSTAGDLSLIRERGIELTWEADPDITVTGNRELLTRLLVNLVSNAYRYGRDLGHIYVKLSDCGDSVSLSVEDDGVGISEDEQKKIFDRFYQTDKSRTDAGFGLGLSMVAEIANFHGGSIGVKSEEGVGSTFTFTMPK